MTFSGTSQIAAAVLVLLCGCASNTSLQRPEASSPELSISLVLPSGESLDVSQGVAYLHGPDGAVRAKNDHVIRPKDSGGACIAGGFRGAMRAGKGFALNNQLCSGWFFIEEELTFSPSPNGYVLTRFSANYLDRRTAEPSGLPRVLTTADFGKLSFSDADPDKLYRLLK